MMRRQPVCHRAGRPACYQTGAGPAWDPVSTVSYLSRFRLQTVWRFHAAVRSFLPGVVVLSLA